MEQLLCSDVEARETLAVLDPLVQDALEANEQVDL